MRIRRVLFGFLVFLGAVGLEACSDLQKGAEKYRLMQEEDSLRAAIAQTRSRLDSLRRVNDSLLRVLKSMDLPDRLGN